MPAVIPGRTPPAGTGTPPPWMGGAYTGGRPQGFEIPGFVTGVNNEDRWKNYLTYLSQNPRTRGNRILHGMTGFQQDSGYTPRTPSVPGPPSTPPPAAPPPAAGTPGAPIFPGQAVTTPSGPVPGATGAMPAQGAYNDPFSMFLSAVPGMRLNTQRGIGDAMASAGFTGNRWGTSAMGKAAEIGAQGAMQENALLQKLLYDYANQAENRALQATGMSMGLGGMLDQMAQDRVRLPFQVGQFEQGRADQMAMFPYLDFQQNRLGWLPMMMQAAMSQGAGSPGSIYQTQTQGSPGAADWLTLLGGLFGAFA